MAELHGVYGVLQNAVNQDTVNYGKIPVYVGTAPVHALLGGSGNVNKPMLVSSFEKAKALFGYRDDWAAFTLCEAIHAHFMLKKVGPIILINVLDATKHKAAEAATKSATPAGGKIVLNDMQSAVIDSVIVGTLSADKYTLSYDDLTGKLTITETAAGSLGAVELDITYNVVDPAAVEDDDLIGAYDGEAVSTGMQAVRNVYQLTGQMPGTLLCPGFSHVKTVHDAMAAITQKINGHFDNFFYTDIPLAQVDTPMTLTGAATWKGTNAFTVEHEKPFFPMWETTDGKKYHLSVLYAAEKQRITALAKGVPYQTASNTALPAGKPYYGAGRDTFLPDVKSINEHLLAKGITSAAFVGGEWKLWGAHTAAYDADAEESGMSIAETNLEMLQYLLNRFQVQYVQEIDQPTTRNRLQSIAAAENAYMDGLLSIGALLYGRCIVIINRDNADALKKGDFEFAFEATTTPLSKSLTAKLSYTEAGLASFFEEVA
jgi:phage tail sheath protein FI